MTGLPWIGAIALLVLWAAAAPAHAQALAPLRIEHAVITRQAQADNGTAHVYVFNPNARTVAVTDCSLEGIERTPAADLAALLDVSQGPVEPDLPYLWWRSLQNPIPPQAFADLAVKLAQPPVRKIKLRFSLSEGPTLERELDRINDALNVTSVGFSPRFDALFAYVENRLEEPVRVRRVALGGVDMTERTRVLFDPIAPRGKGAVVIRLEQPVEPGTVVFLRMTGEPAADGAVLVRAFAAFPITWQDGSLPEGLDAAGADHTVRPGSVRGEGLPGFEHIMRCPAHAHGSRQEAAAKFIALHEKLMRAEPHVPGILYVCRWEKEINCFVFCELPDVARIMPFAGSPAYVPEPLNHRVQWLTALAVQAAAPRPVHAVVPIRFEDSHQWERSCTPDEIRALVYLPLSRGAKGLSYGERQIGLGDDANQELAQVTREVAGLRDFLLFAEPMPLGTTDHPLVEAATLLSGDRALILLLINHAFGDFDNDRVLRCPPQRGVRTSVRLPPALSVASVRDVQDPARSVSWRQEGARLLVETDEVKVVRPYLVLFDSIATAQPGNRASDGERP